MRENPERKDPSECGDWGKELNRKSRIHKCLEICLEVRVLKMEGADTPIAPLVLHHRDDVPIVFRSCVVVNVAGVSALFRHWNQLIFVHRNGHPLLISVLAAPSSP